MRRSLKTPKRTHLRTVFPDHDQLHDHPLPTHGLTAARVLCIAAPAGGGFLAATASAPTVSFAIRGGRFTASITLR